MADMRTFGSIAGLSLLLLACGGRDPAPAPGNESATASGNVQAPAAPPPEPAVAAAAAPRWDLRSSGEGVALALQAGSEPAAIRLFCPAGGKTLLVNVPAFKPVGSEERLSFGSGGTAIALVADTRGDKARGGVSGAGAVPADLAALIAGPLSASYGAQRSGPHEAPPAKLSRDFAAACAAGTAPAPLAPPVAASGPCYLQDGKPISSRPLRAVGTEPFWGARIEGRCVTYSHPDDQKGTRIWTRFVPGPSGGGTWSGALGGQRFELRIRAAPGCSDGMSDKSYPLAADLVVAGERRTGCAE
jgi:hypothetical protein